MATNRGDSSDRYRREQEESIRHTTNILWISEILRALTIIDRPTIRSIRFTLKDSPYLVMKIDITYTTGKSELIKISTSTMLRGIPPYKELPPVTNDFIGENDAMIRARLAELEGRDTASRGKLQSVLTGSVKKLAAASAAPRAEGPKGKGSFLPETAFQRMKREEDERKAAAAASAPRETPFQRLVRESREKKEADAVAAMERSAAAPAEAYGDRFLKELQAEAARTAAAPAPAPAPAPAAGAAPPAPAEPLLARRPLGLRVKLSAAIPAPAPVIEGVKLDPGQRPADGGKRHRKTTRKRRRAHRAQTKRRRSHAKI